MRSEQFQRVRSLFDAALALLPTERKEFIRAGCPDDAEVRDRVLALLAQDESPSAFLQTPLMGSAANINNLLGGEIGLAAEREHPPTIGPYRILRALGEGGMGVVYLAQQVHPQRQVALKIIRTPYASSSALKRFDREIEAVGRLQHPGIAQIYDAGTFDAGFGAQPYFTMEYVVGQPLTKFVADRGLGTRQRMVLMVSICRAVQHAHERGVIHRDLKPANILVDAHQQPKILDFGIARATAADLRITTLRTDVGSLVGTVAYMSPELVLGDPTRIDPRSDVYSLGVIAYELLAGSLPYNLHNRSVPEAARIIQDEDPTPLSSISRIFRGDLQTIIAKALEKEPERRYASAEALANDIERYLRHEPIIARPVTTIYQLTKFARRNRALVGSVLALMVVLLGASIVSTSLYMRARRQSVLREQQRDRADFAAYTASISAAEAAIRGCDIAEARRRLDEAPAALRGWEWRHLLGRSDRSRITLTGHAGPIDGVAWSPDGMRIASAGNDCTVRIWNAADGRLLQTLKGHGRIVRSVRYSPDGSMLASCSWEDTARVWRASDGATIALLPHADLVSTLDWSPDGSLLATGDTRQVVTLWSMAELAATARSNTHSTVEPVRLSPRATLRDDSLITTLQAGAIVAFSPDGASLAVGYETDALRLWRVSDGTVVARTKTEVRTPVAIAFDPAGRFVAVGYANGRIDLWTPSTGRCTFLAMLQRIMTSLEFSPDGEALLVGVGDGSIRVLDLPSGKERQVLLGHTLSAAAAFSPRADAIASAGYDGTVKVWNKDTNDVPTLAGGAGWVYAMAFSADSARLAWCTGGGGSVDPQSGPIARIHDLHTGSVTSTSRVDGSTSMFFAIAFTPDQANFLTVDRYKNLRLCRVSDGAVLRSMTIGCVPFAVACSPTGRSVVFGGDSEGGGSAFFIIDTEHWDRTIQIADHPSAVLDAVYSHDGRLIATGSRDGIIRLVDTSTRKVVATLEGHTGPVEQVAFSADDSILASASYDRTVGLWSVARRERVATLTGHSRDVMGVAFVPGFNRLASISQDGALRLWDLQTYREVACLHGHSGALQCLAVSPDGKTIATGSIDCTIKLWQVP